MTITKERKKAVLDALLQDAENTYYAQEVKFEIAEELGNKRNADQILEQLGDLKQKMKLLEKKIEELDQEENNEG